LGRSSTGSVPTGMLASTSFLVTNKNIEKTPAEELSTTIPSISEQQPQTPQPQSPQQKQEPAMASINWPWAHFLFWGFMVCFAILVKAKSIFRRSQKEPHWKTVLRESVNTVDTNAATLASVDSHELHHHDSTAQQQQQQQQQQPNVQHHQKRQLRRKSRRKSRTLPREVYDWDESSHSRSNSNSSSSSNNNDSNGSSSRSGIDATQPTVTPSEYSSNYGMDDTVRSDDLDLLDALDDDDSYDEYDHDDIEALKI